jgi:hypothetical protein
MRLFAALAISALMSAHALAAETLVKPMVLPIMASNGVASGNWDMASYKNGVFVFEAYMNFCSYCNTNAPLVNQLTTVWKDQPRVQVLDLSGDTSPREYAAWFSKHKPNHLVLNDGAKKMFWQMATQNLLPQTFVVNCRGQIIDSHLGGWDSSTMANINSAINEALQTVCE